MLKNFIFLAAFIVSTPCLAAIEHIVPGEEGNTHSISDAEQNVLEDIKRQNMLAMQQQREQLMQQQPTGGTGGFSAMDEVEVEEEDEARAKAERGIPGLKADVNVEMMKISQDLNVRNGNLFDVILPVEPGRKWNYDTTDDKIAKRLDSTESAEYTVYNFEATEDGFDRLYFDYIEVVDGNVSVVESRILDLVVGVPGAQAKQN